MKHSRRDFIRKGLLAAGASTALACGKELEPPITKCEPPVATKTSEIPPEAITKKPENPVLAGLDLDQFHLHNPMPVALETKRESVGIDPITPINRLFIRNNLPHPPASILEAPENWEVNVGGVKSPRSFTLAQLKEIGFDTETSVLQCSGNGRAFFEHEPSGSPWSTGAAGNVVWGGVRLRDVLALCGGPLPEMKFITSTGADRPPAGVDVSHGLVERSVPIEKGMDDCLLAWTLNGEPIPLSHGGPLRMVVPGYFGCNQIKYVKDINATLSQSSAKIQKSGYRFRPIGQKGDSAQPSMWRMPVKSWLVKGQQNADKSSTQFFGVAFSGERGVSKVEFSVDDGKTWGSASFYGPDMGANAWRCFQFQARGVDETTVVYTRATDRKGGVQPEHRVENERGYGHNAWRDHGLALQGVSAKETVSTTEDLPLTPEEEVLGKKLFTADATPPCGVCHTLEEAKTAGQIGPNLDQLKPSEKRVERAVTSGVGAMPAYGQTLTKEQIRTLARFVSRVAGKNAVKP